MSTTPTFLPCLCSLGMHAYPWPDWRARMRGIDPNLCVRCGKERDRD